MNDGFNILLVEDNEGDHFLFEQIIKTISPNLQLNWVTDGEAAIVFLESAARDPDIIFLDINMPRMNGHEFMEAYGHTIVDKKIPVYVLTSSTHERDRVLFSPYECISGYLIKSASYSEISAIFEELMTNRTSE